MQEKKIVTDALDTEIRYLKGVGPKRADVLHKIGIDTIEDMLYYLPTRYEDRGNFTLIKDLNINERQTVKGKVLAHSSYRTKTGIDVFQLALGDKTGVIFCVWFNQPFLKNIFKKGEELVVYGKVEKYDKLQINHPEYEIIKGEKDSLNIGRIVPVYHLTYELSQRYMRCIVHEAIKHFAGFLKDIIPTPIRARRRLVDIGFAIHNIHFPNSFQNLNRAYRRIVFEEFFILQLALALRKRDIKNMLSGISHRLDSDLLKMFKKMLPFELTTSQLGAIRDIQHDMSSTKPMNRMLQGDVGSGKTIVAMYAILLTVKNGYQAAFMAPTEILARQHYITYSEYLMALGINVRLLISGISKEKKSEIKREIGEGRVDVVIGTHALIWEDVKFKRLGLVVCDEQHKFGVSQRYLLKKKGMNPDVLIMTATPIPRTLALTVYGDLDISVLKELPKGRQQVSTYWVEEKSRREVYQFLREEIKKGHQAYIVYPRIWSIGRRHSRVSGPKAASSMYNKLQEEIFPDLRLALLHGRMNTQEKEKIMKDFREGKIDILISTTVIEVGIDVSNATCMVIENAERFGLSQLHQMRGRIGRGEHHSYCILIGNPKTDSAKKRLYTMSQTHDGFRIAREDLELRGPGEFFGTRQHGLPEIRFGSILKDFEIMEEARYEAFHLVREDPQLKEGRNALLKEKLKARFKDNFMIDVG